MKRNIYLLGAVSLLVIGIFGCSDDSSTGPESTDYVEQIVNAVNIDSLMNYVSILSGETSASINGQTQTILSRHKEHEGNEIAAGYIRQKLDSYGMTVTTQQFSATGKNVLGRKTGSLYPDDIYIFCAHYDSQPNNSIAPGADDNASGTAAVLEAARILSQYDFEYTVIFALWDEEEQGLIGSRFYAGEAVSNDMNILGVINLDMISWETDNDPILKIQKSAAEEAENITDILIDVDNSYDLWVIPEIEDGVSGSDHKSFAELGFPAIMLIEDYVNDWNANYHTPQDVLTEMNSTYFSAASQLAIGTLARLLMISAE